MFILCFECALCLAGYSVYEYQEYKVESDPSLPYLADDSMGIILNEGKYKITLNEGLTFTADHLDSGFRRVGEGDIVTKEKEVLFSSPSYFVL